MLADRSSLEPPGEIASSSLIVCNDAAYFRAHRAHLAHRLVRDGWRVWVMAGEADDRDQAEGIEKLSVERRHFSPIRDFKLFREVRRKISSIDPDVVHLITMKPIVFAGLACLLTPRRGAKRRCVATFPGLGRAYAGTSRSARLRTALVTSILRAIFRRTNMIATFETEADRDLLVRLGVVEAARAHVMNGAGLNLDLFEMAPKQPDDKALRFLWASRLLKGKGLGIFVEAARRASQLGMAVEFIVAGYGDPGHPDNLSADELQKMVDHPAIRFVGHVTDMPALLRSADVLVLPSSYAEGIPRILIEAAAAGLPTVVSDQPGCRRITRDGTTGIVLKALTADELLDAISVLNGNRARTHKMGVSARKLVADQGFSERKVQDAFMACYAI